MVKGYKKGKFKGKNHWNYGRTLSLSVRKKISKNNARFWLGKKRPDMKGNKFGIGIALSRAHKEKLIKSITGPKNKNWKGNKVKYRALHDWVYCHRGSPEKCEFCGKIKDTPKSIHWANKSGRYLRDLSDWIRLCVSCHKKYDLNLCQSHQFIQQ